MSRKALLEIGRVSNLPTCMSNATVGFCLGGGNPLSRPGLWLAAVAATVLFYEAGMVLNDVCDLETDRIERPERPLPSGRISRSAAIGGVVALTASGLAIVAGGFPAALPFALALLTLIAVYDVFHARFAFAPLLMGACRGSIYLLAAAAAASDAPGGWSALPFPTWPMALVLTGYIASVSFLARDELSRDLSLTQKTGVTLAALALLAPLAVTGAWSALPLVALLGAVAWWALTCVRLLRRRIPTGAAVGSLLAGMSLLDAVVLASLARPLGAAFAAACFGGIVLGHRKVRGT